VHPKAAFFESLKYTKSRQKNQAKFYSENKVTGVGRCDQSGGVPAHRPGSSPGRMGIIYPNLFNARQNCIRATSTGNNSDDYLPWFIYRAAKLQPEPTAPTPISRGLPPARFQSDNHVVTRFSGYKSVRKIYLLH
jgi:hypothetical protein